MGKLDNMATYSSMTKEDNIFKLLMLLQKGTNLKEIDYTLQKTPITIYRYLRTIQQAQFNNPVYQKLLKNLKGCDEFQTKEIANWQKSLKSTTTVDEHLTQFEQTENMTFYDDLHYFLLCYKFLSTNK